MTTAQTDGPTLPWKLVSPPLAHTVADAIRFVTDALSSEEACVAAATHTVCCVPAFPYLQDNLSAIVDAESHLHVDDDLVVRARIFAPTRSTTRPWTIAPRDSVRQGVEWLAHFGFLLSFERALTGEWLCTQRPKNFDVWWTWRGTFWFPLHEKPIRFRSVPPCHVRYQPLEDVWRCESANMDSVENAAEMATLFDAVHAFLLTGRLPFIHWDNMHTNDDLFRLHHLAWALVWTWQEKRQEDNIDKAVTAIVTQSLLREDREQSWTHADWLLWLADHDRHGKTVASHVLQTRLWHPLVCATRCWTTLPAPTVTPEEVWRVWWTISDRLPDRSVHAEPFFVEADMEEKDLPRLAVRVDDIALAKHDLCSWLDVPTLLLQRPKAGAPTTFRRLNPSVVPHEDGTWTVLVRFANYDVNTYRSWDRSDVVTTHNLLSRWDFRGGAVAVEPWSWIRDDYRKDASAWIRGLEDMRLFETAPGQLRFLSNCCDYEGDTTEESGDRVSVLLGALTRGEDGEWVARASKIYLPFPRKTCEKNWIAVPWRGRLFVIYELLPLTILEIDVDTMEVTVCARVHDVRCPDLHGSLRGSGRWTEVEESSGRFVGVVHEVVFVENVRHYVHRIVSIDLRRLIEDDAHAADAIVYSRPFCFTDLKRHRIQYALDMVRWQENEIAISLSLTDEQPQLWTWSRAKLAAAIDAPFLLPRASLARVPRWTRVLKKCETFPLILWINRDRDATRQKTFVAQMRRLHLSHQRVRAVEPHHGGLWSLFQRGPDSVHENDATKALVCSHVLAMMTFLQAFPDLSHVCIMEDDASLEWVTEWPFHNWSTWAARAPRPFSILHLSCHLPPEEMKTSAVHPHQWVPLRPYSTTMAYLVSREGAQNFVSWALTFPLPRLSVSDKDVFAHAVSDKHPAYMTSVPLVTFRAACDSVIHADHADHQMKCKAGALSTWRSVRRVAAA